MAGRTEESHRFNEATAISCGDRRGPPSAGRRDRRASTRPQRLAVEIWCGARTPCTASTRFNEATAISCGDPEGPARRWHRLSRASTRPQRLAVEIVSDQGSGDRTENRFNEATAISCGDLSPTNSCDIANSASTRPQRLAVEIHLAPEPRRQCRVRLQRGHSD